jgi:DNA-binding transcriptional LysR family regulator
MIDIVKLKTFTTVADLGSFSKSSDVLYVTQPAITQQIKSLEKTIGCRLLRRQGGKIVLTEEGERLYQKAKILLDSYDNLVKEMSQLKKDIKDTLYIGSSPTFGEYKLPKLIVDFQKLYPSITVKLYVDTSKKIEDGILNGVINVGVVDKDVDDKINSVELFRDELVLCVGKNHELTRKSIIDPEELYTIDLVMREAYSCTRKAVKESLESMGLNFELLNIKIETNSMISIANIVKSGYGASFFPKSSIQKDLEQGELIPIKVRNFNAYKVFNIIYYTNFVKSALVDRFIQFILSHKDSLGEAVGFRS